MVALLAYSRFQLRPFDPQQTLAQAASQSDFDQQLTAVLRQQGIENQTLVHLRTSHSCYCETLTAPHQAELAHSLSAYHQVSLNVDEIPALAHILGTVPALAVIDEVGQLRYLGPYALGYGCITGNTLISWIQKLISAKQFLGATINSDAQGCFCPV